jgi:hypothetical protein
MDVSESPPPPPQYCELPSLEDVSVASLSVTENDGEPTEMEIEAAASFVPPMVAAAAAASSVKTEFTGDDLPEAAVKGNSKELSAEEEEEARWTVAKIFFQNRSLVEHQLRSFNEFLEDGLQAMVNDAPPFEVSPDHNPAAIRIEGLPRQARISYGNVSVGKPTCSATEDKKDFVDLYPREARLRNLTYSAPINLDMNLKVCRSIDITLWWRHLLWQHSIFWISFPLILYWLKLCFRLLCKVFFASLSDIIII